MTEKKFFKLLFWCFLSYCKVGGGWVVVFREYFSIFLNMEAPPGIVEGGMTTIKSKTEKMSSTEGHKNTRRHNGGHIPTLYI